MALLSATRKGSVKLLHEAMQRATGTLAAPSLSVLAKRHFAAQPEISEQQSTFRFQEDLQYVMSILYTLPSYYEPSIVDP